MDSKSQGYVTVRVVEASDPGEWELFTPDGTLIEGWHHLSVGRDHSGRCSLHVIFDQFTCVNTDGQPVEMHLTGPIPKHQDELPPLPSARTHRHPH
ncbi:MAG: hypothetical protein AB7T38_13925 [Nitrospirales bacterium]